MQRRWELQWQATAIVWETNNRQKVTLWGDALEEALQSFKGDLSREHNTAAPVRAQNEVVTRVAKAEAAVPPHPPQFRSYLCVTGSEQLHLALRDN